MYKLGFSSHQIHQIQSSFYEYYSSTVVVSRSSQNITYSWIPDVVHDELDFVLVPLRPGRGDVDQPREEEDTVRYHVEIQLPPGEEDDRLEHHLRLPELPVEVAGHGGALSARPTTENEDEFHSTLQCRLLKTISSGISISTWDRLAFTAYSNQCEKNIAASMSPAGRKWQFRGEHELWVIGENIQAGEDL